MYAQSRLHTLTPYWLMLIVFALFLYFVESPELWKWERTSIIHRQKFVKLLEYKQDHPQKINEINDVRVCFSNEFVIGRGSVGTRVYVGLGKDGYERAVKRLPRDSCACLAEQEKKMLNVSSTIESNHVVKYRFLDDKFDEDWLYLIMDLYEETLEQFVKRSSLADCLVSARNIIQQVLMGLADLHGNQLLHRDLKPCNILRDVLGEWLLADFGISRILTQEASTFRSMERGTKNWRAVESYSPNGRTDVVRYKKKSDIQVGFVLTTNMSIFLFSNTCYYQLGKLSMLMSAYFMTGRHITYSKICPDSNRMLTHYKYTNTSLLPNNNVLTDSSMHLIIPTTSSSHDNMCSGIWFSLGLSCNQESRKSCNFTAPSCG